MKYKMSKAGMFCVALVFAGLVSYAVYADDGRSSGKKPMGAIEKWSAETFDSPEEIVQIVNAIENRRLRYTAAFTSWTTLGSNGLLCGADAFLESRWAFLPFGHRMPSQIENLELSDVDESNWPNFIWRVEIVRSYKEAVLIARRAHLSMIGDRPQIVGFLPTQGSCSRRHDRHEPSKFAVFYLFRPPQNNTLGSEKE